MRLLTPLGLIGLLGLVIWLVIYLLKPNYQNKYISSTYIWKLSLKYKKKNIPISKLRHILLLICQVLMICAAVFILANPVLVRPVEKTGPDKIIVLDASASMRSEFEGVTRYQRAVDEIRNLADNAIDQGGTITLVSADTESKLLLSDCTDKGTLGTVLDELRCSYGVADVDGAMDIAFEVLQDKQDAEVCFFTDTTYGNSGRVTVYNMSKVDKNKSNGEWNTAILDVRTSFSDGFYTFEVDVACYGKDQNVLLKGEVGKANGGEASMRLPTAEVDCRDDETFTVIFTYSMSKHDDNTQFVILNENQKVFSYDYVRFYVDDTEGGSISTDNEFYVYGGTMPKVRIQYYSTKPNVFFRNIIIAIRDEWAKQHLMDIELKVIPEGGEPELSGYDVYIFEHKVPDRLPSDGVLFLLDPDKPANAGFSIKRRITITNPSDTDGEPLSVVNASHPIMKYIESSAIKVTEYTQVDESSLFDYDVLLNYQGNPVFFVKNTVDTKIAVMTFSINKSNMGISMFFPIMMNNALSYFFPQTFEKYDYAVNDEVTLNARGSSLEVTSADGEKQSYSEFPAKVTASAPGTYTVVQNLLGDKTLIENFYVRVDSSESNISRVEAVLDNPEYTPIVREWYDDLLLYLAIALFVLSIAEWLLHIKEGS